MAPSDGNDGRQGECSAPGKGGVESGYPGVADRVPTGTRVDGPPAPLEPSDPTDPFEPSGPPEETEPPEDEGPTYGFATRLEFLDHLERSQALYQRIPLEDRNFDRALMGLAPLSEEEVVREIREPERRRGRQVGIKLSTRDYSRLVDAADLFGATPTTLARLLLNRAVAAVLSFEPEPEPASSPELRRSGSGP
jgi:hypothetical protein